MASRIPIHVSNHTAFVWDVDHVATLRSAHRICGVLSGTLPNLTQQNVFLGLPLVLMPEELVLLVEKQLATIVHDPAAHRAPTPAQLEAWDASRRQDVAQRQLTRLERQRRKDEERTTTTTTTAVPIDVAEEEDPTSTGPSTQTQKQKREAVGRRHRRSLMDADAAGADADAEADDDADADADAVTGTIDVAIGGNRGGEGALSVPAAVPSKSSVYTVSVPTTSDAFAWYDYDHDEEEDHHGPATSSSGPRQWHRRTTYETLDAARAAGVWSYPANADERARCEVFRDLWEKGYYMGGGIKFGGDWLVYPGDPLRYHSHFVATVQTSPSTPLRPMEVVAHGRLGTATKKAHLLCGWDPDSREVTYISIEWAGFG